MSGTREDGIDYVFEKAFRDAERDDAKRRRRAKAIAKVDRSNEERLNDYVFSIGEYGLSKVRETTEAAARGELARRTGEQFKPESVVLVSVTETRYWRAKSGPRVRVTGPGGVAEHALADISTVAHLDEDEARALRAGDRVVLEGGLSLELVS